MPIYINHIGYLPSLPKIALVSASTGLPYELIRITKESKEQSVYKSMLKLKSANDSFSGAHIWEADFSIIRATGTYRLHVTGIGDSHSFQILPNLYSQAANQSLKSFYYHRSGVELPKKFAGEWSRPSQHERDAIVYDENKENSQIHNATGGWYDGRDMGKYTVSGTYAAGKLMQLYEIKPHLFQDTTIGIPEFRNEVPDILDEVRWEIEWLMRMQREDGAVYHKIAPKESDNAATNNGEKSKRFIFPVSTAATASACAVLAKASRVYQHYDPAFAAQCFASSVKAWEFLSLHSEPIVFQNPEGVLTKSYSDKDDNDERIWAAIELYISTGDPTYFTTVQILTEKRIPLISSAGYWAQVMPLAAGSVVVNPTLFKGTKLLDEIVDDLTSLSESIVEKTQNSGFRVSIGEDDFLWGSNNVLLQNAVILLTTHYARPNAEYVAAALDQLHYVLGRNPLSMSFVTAAATQSPQKPYHFYRHILKDAKPVPGLLVSGPNKAVNDGVTNRLFAADTPIGLMYKDDADNFSTNETSITWNAAFTFTAAWIDDEDLNN